MHVNVLAMRHDDEVVGGVIGCVAVSVVDYFSFYVHSLAMEDMPVLEYTLTIYKYADITILAAMTATFESRRLRSCTAKHAIVGTGN